MYFLGIISAVHDVTIRFLGFMTFFQKYKSMLRLMDAVFGYHEPGNELLIGIDSDGSFQEMFSHLTGTEGVIMTGITAGEPGRIDGGDGNCIAGGIEYFQGTFKENIEIDRLDPAEEFLNRGEVRDRCESQKFPNSIHLFEIADDCPVVFFPVFLEEKDGQKLVLGIISPRIFTGIQGEMG